MYDSLQNQLQQYLQKHNLTKTLYLEYDDIEYVKIRLISLSASDKKYGLKVKFTDDLESTFNTVVEGIHALLRRVSQEN